MKSSWITRGTLKQMTNVFKKETWGRSETGRGREGIDTEKKASESGDSQRSDVGTSWGTRGATRNWGQGGSGGKKGFSSEALKWAGACAQLDFGLLSPWTLKEHSFGCFKPPRLVGSRCTCLTIHSTATDFICLSYSEAADCHVHQWL